MEDVIEREFDAATTPSLTIRNTSGNIMIDGEDSGTIRVRATKTGTERELAETIVEFEQIGRELVVTTRGRGQTCPVEYAVITPANCEIQAFSTSGQILVRNLNATIRADNSSGSIVVESVRAECVLRSVSGSIDLVGMTGKLVVGSASGSVNVLESQLLGCDLHTASGDMHIETPLLTKETYTADTASGTLTLQVPADARATLTLQTASGTITADHPIHIEKKDSGRWHGRLNGGGAQVRMHSASGIVRIELDGGADAVDSGSGNAIDMRRGESWRDPMPSTTTDVLQALERGDLTLDDAMERLNNV